MKSFRRAAGVVFTAALTVFAGAQDSDRSRLEFYQSAYAELSPEQDPRAARAQEIFAQILKVAGTRAGLVPRLFIAKNTSPPPPPAVAIPDGGVIISEQTLDLCYKIPDKGEDRLAYILAHEIAHQLKNDFWPVMFFQAVELSRKNDPKDGPTLEEIKREIALGENEAAAEQRRREFEADEMGIIFASLAGFDTRAVVMDDGTVNLFRYVESYLDPTNIKGVVKDASHPTPDARAAAVKARLMKVLDSLDLFDVGLLFYRAGDYERSAALFAEFLREYPSREVYHNLAVCHHQIARRFYREWKENKGFSFKLSLPAESETRARRITLRGPAPGPNPETRFKQEIDQAIEFYRRALAQDPAFWPSANNLGCALLLLENPYESVGHMQKALQGAPASPLVLNNLGVAYYLTGNIPKAKEELQAALKADPMYDAPLFNLGLIASLESDQAAATQWWNAYLRLDTSSSWAKQIYLKRGTEAVPPAGSSESDEAKETLSGVSTDDYDDQIPADWGNPVKEKSLPGGLDIKAYANGILMVARNGQILGLSSTPPYKDKTAGGLTFGASQEALTARYGRPAISLPSSLGEDWIYPSKGIAFVLRDGKVASWILFKRT